MKLWLLLGCVGVAWFVAPAPTRAGSPQAPLDRITVVRPTAAEGPAVQTLPPPAEVLPTAPAPEAEPAAPGPGCPGCAPLAERTIALPRHTLVEEDKAITIPRLDIHYEVVGLAAGLEVDYSKTEKREVIA